MTKGLHVAYPADMVTPLHCVFLLKTLGLSGDDIDNKELHRRRKSDCTTEN